MFAQLIVLLRTLLTSIDKASHEATKSTTPTTTTVNEPDTNQVSDPTKAEQPEVPNGANDRKAKTPEPPTESTPNIPTASAHPSQKEPAQPPTNSASDTRAPITPPQPPTDGRVIFGIVQRLITLYALSISLRTIIEFSRHLLLPQLDPHDFWYRMLVEFIIGFAVVRYQRVVERYTYYIRVALSAYYLYRIVREW